MEQAGGKQIRARGIDRVERRFIVVKYMGSRNAHEMAKSREEKMHMEW